MSIPASGSLSVTVTTASLTLNQLPGGSDATGGAPAGAVQVDETRNTYPGWSVSGQVTDFTGSDAAVGWTIPGSQLGWTPLGSLAAGAVLGQAVTPAAPGIAAPAVLASAPPGEGFGQFSLGFALDLLIPASARAGSYSANLSITYIDSGP